MPKEKKPNAFEEMIQKAKDKLNPDGLRTRPLKKKKKDKKKNAFK